MDFNTGFRVSHPNFRFPSLLPGHPDRSGGICFSLTFPISAFCFLISSFLLFPRLPNFCLLLSSFLFPRHPKAFFGIKPRPPTRTKWQQLIFIRRAAGLKAMYGS